ncbi:MAG: hypothetical protein AAGC65_12745 [Mucilaginibacter sp.]|uniref:hypothetical protein n=1 Tax=Mucilaginibacter sp. TaxID=1882438 RepID=UPI0031A1C699
MKRKKMLLWALILLAVAWSATRFKSIAEDFDARVYGYYHEKIGPTLFLHIDKSIYIPNESIWFKAYILNGEPLQNEVLYVRLLNEQKQIVLQQEFPVYDIRSHGDMLIPITTAPGHYKLIAYTDKMISFNPENVFVQQVQVVKDQSSDLETEALIADSTVFSAGKRPEIMVKVTSNDHEVSKAKGIYKIYRADKKIIAEGKFLTGATGIAVFNFNYPELAASDNLFLECDVTDKQQTKKLHIRLPKNPVTVSAACYPEGGHLINGTSNKVFIAVTDAGGQPAIVRLILKSGEKQIISVATDGRGYAIVNFTPNINEKYSLLLQGHGYSKTIAFPVKIEPAGYVIQLAGSPDHPFMVVKNQNMPRNVVLMGRTISALKFNRSLTIKSGDSVRVVLPQNDSVNHVIDLGLFDENNKLLAERLVYIPTAEKYHVSLRFDKTSYKSRGKVRADIAVTDGNGSPVAANFSVAVVANQTLDPLAEKRITQTDLYALQNYTSVVSDVNDINNELIRENIRSGSWADIMNYQPKGKINTFSNAAGVFGYVVSKKKKKIALKTLYLYSKNGLTEVAVNENGSFSIPAKDLVTQRGDTKYLIVDKDFNNRYDLQIKNYPADFDARITMISLPESQLFYSPLKRADQIASIMSGKILKEVVIKGAKNTSTVPGDFNATEYHSLNCTDYVCFYNILNCKNHTTGGSPPVEGQIYVLDGRPVRYHGCSSNNEKSNTYKVKNIDLPQNFYLPDYEKEPVSTPELQSTLFWDPNFNTGPNGKSRIEFYTSDIKGAFNIVVQGLTINGLTPVFGKIEFKVIQKNPVSSK